MAGLMGISIKETRRQGNFLNDLFWGTFYQQHLGEKYAGLATFNQGQINLRTREGLFRSNFENNLGGLEGNSGIGYCGNNQEPYQANSKLGQFSLCFTGNIINLNELVTRFKSFGHTFERADCIEILAKLLAQGNNIIEGINNINQQVQGAYSILVLTPAGIYATSSSCGHWPLVIGGKKGAVIVATESGGFYNLGFKLIGQIKPGEIIHLHNGCYRTVGEVSGKAVQACSFIWVYTAFVNAVYKGIVASVVREKLGAILARRDIEQGFIPDIVAPVPDSGRFHAIGYKAEFDKQMIERKINRVPLYKEVLLKYSYAGRSYTPDNKEARDLEAQIKLLISGERFPGKVVVICDDSIVRGTQTQTNLVPKLRALGIKEIHLRISNPELLSHCKWGQTTKKGEVLATLYPNLEDKIKYLKVDGLRYNSIQDLVEAIGLPGEELCMDCDKV